MSSELVNIAPESSWKQQQHHRDLNLEVTRLRRRATMETDPAALLRAGEQTWLEIVRPTPFAEAEVDLHLSQSDRLHVLAYSTLVSSRAVNLALATVIDPSLLISVVAQITQIGLLDFTNPKTQKKIRNVSIAKSLGAFFTPAHVASNMAARALEDKVLVGNVVDIAAGTGSLAGHFLVAAASQHVHVDAVTIVERSPYFASIASLLLNRVAQLTGLKVDLTVICDDALEYCASNPSSADVVLMNPPYGRPRFLKSSLTNAESKSTSSAVQIKAQADEARMKVKRTARLFGLEAAPDYQTVFLAAGRFLTAPRGSFVAISPSTWLSSRAGAPLRDLVVRSGSLSAVQLFAESEALFTTVNQHLAITKVSGSDLDFPNIKVQYDANGMTHAEEIPLTTLEPTGPNRWKISLGTAAPPAIAALGGYRRLRDLPDVRNKRGELDLTIDSGLISETPTAHRLLRGEAVDRFQIADPARNSRASFVTDAGAQVLQARKKGGDSAQRRIVGRQVSYQGKARRLTFAMAETGAFVANSCNYVTSSNEDTLWQVLAVLNSAVVEDWFRAQSGTNHVSNYEIDDIPWPDADTHCQLALQNVARELSEYAATSTWGFAATGAPIENLLEAIVAFAYKIPYEFADELFRRRCPGRNAAILAHLDSFYRNGLPSEILTEGGLLRHTVPTLSDLDRRMIRHVPQGGNWQNIPEEVPSARLDQIRAMAAERGVVRTTYYGRLRPEQPSYTIATYYNRPGNGTNIHPYEDRTLTHREAARLQSFPDEYAFLGSEGSVRKQIGNAVPPRLGYAVGKSLLSEVTADNTAVDLFSGAGGLSVGLERAGFKILAAAEIDEQCKRTYTFNHPIDQIADPYAPGTVFVQGDLSSPLAREAAFARIQQKLGGRKLGLLAGGPPCQGFSHAGFRSLSDKRNDLAVAFMDFVERLQPNAVLIENVEGILTYDKGRVARELIETLAELGYSVASPWVLAAECYGVPQMRRRVFIAASLRGEPVLPEATHQRCGGRRKVEATMNVSGLPVPVTVQEAFEHLPAAQNLRLRD